MNQIFTTRTVNKERTKKLQHFPDELDNMHVYALAMEKKRRLIRPASGRIIVRFFENFARYPASWSTSALCRLLFYKMGRLFEDTKFLARQRCEKTILCWSWLYVHSSLNLSCTQVIVQIWIHNARELAKRSNPETNQKCKSFGHFNITLLTILAIISLLGAILAHLVELESCTFFSRALLLARSDSTSHSAMLSVCLVVYPPPPNIISRQLRQF